MRRNKRLLAIFLALMLVVTPFAIPQELAVVHAENNDSSEEPQSENVKQAGEEELSEETKQAEEGELSEETKQAEDAEQSETVKQSEEISRAESASGIEKSSTMTAAENEFFVESVEAVGEVDQLEAPTQVQIKMVINDSGNKGIDHFNLTFYCEERQNHIYIEKNKYDEGWKIEGNNYILTFEVDEFVQKGTYRLDSFTISAANYEVYKYYGYDVEQGKFVTLEGEEGFECSEGVSFTVVSSGMEDNIAPEATAVRCLTEGPYYSNTTLEYEVDVKEEGSGIRNISLSFRDTENEGYSMVLEASDILPGTDLVTLSCYGCDPSEYKVDQLYIEDKAGNITCYAVQEDGKTLTTWINNEEKSIVVEDNTIVIEFVKDNSPKIKAMRFEDGMDPENMSAGDTFKTIVTLQNEGSKSMQIEAESCQISWEWENKPGNYKYDRGKGIGEEITLSPSETRELVLETTINQYSGMGERILRGIEIQGYCEDGTRMYVSYMNEGWREVLIAYNMENAIVDAFPHNGAMNYKVTKAEQPDEEAPIIESVTVAEESLKAPGPITFKIKTSDEEIAPVSLITLGFQDVNIPQNYLPFGPDGDGQVEAEKEKITYSESEGCYIYQKELDEMVVKGTYELVSIYISDEAGNSTVYNNHEGIMKDDNRNNISFSSYRFTVVEGNEEDVDFEGPKLKDVELLTKETESAGEIQVKIDAEDVSGLGSVGLSYVKEYMENLWLYTDDIVKESDGYLCTFKVDKYCTPGLYELCELHLYDASMRGNGRNYGCLESEETTTFKEWGIEDSQVTISGSMNLTISGNEDYIVTTIDKVTEEVEQADEGATIVIKGVDEETKELPQDFISQVKEKELTVVVLDTYNTNTEIEIKGADLKDAGIDTLAMSIRQEGLCVDSIQVGEKVDDLYCPIAVTSSSTDIPVTIRVKVDEEFLWMCGNSGITFSKMNPSNGTNEILADNLRADKEGYIEVSLPAGWNTAKVAAAKVKAKTKAVQSDDYTFYVSAKKVEEGDFILGDINGDGDVNIIDVTKSLYHVSQRDILDDTQYLAADIDGDGNVTIIDVTKLLYYVTGRSDTLI